MTSGARTTATAGLAALAALAWPGGTAAQEGGLAMTVLNQGKAPEAPVQVSTVSDGRKRAVGRTDDDGRISLPTDLLNVGKGTPVTVTMVTCEGEREVVLVPEGEPQRSCDRAREDPGCDCERLGVIAWGETAAVTIDATQTGVTMTTGTAPGEPAAAAGEEGGAPPPGGQGGTRGAESHVPGFRAGFDAGVAIWPKMEDAVCGQPGIGACDPGDLSLVLNPYVEVRPTSLPLAVGVGGFYSSLSHAQAFGDAGVPTRVESDLDATGVDLFLRAFLPPAEPVRPWLMAGSIWLRNDLTRRIDAGGEVTTEERDENGFRLLGGLGLDWRLAAPLSGRVGLKYRGGGSEDADRDFSFTAGLAFEF